MFNQLLQASGLKGLKITLASMRAGGATDAFINGTSIEILSFKGRWMSLPSLRSYLQEGAAQLAWSRVGAASQSHINRLLLRYRTVLEAPPPNYSLWPQGWRRI